MKRLKIIKLFSSYLRDSDLAIFAGGGICKEACLYDRPGNFYSEDETGIVLSLALGIAMNTDKRVFIFCDDYYFIKNLGASIHIAVSRCKNVFIVVLVSGIYQDRGKNPTIFDSISAYKTMLFGAGFLINDYTKHFSTVSSSKGAQNLLKTLYGPVFISIHVGSEISEEVGEINLTVEERLKRLTTFLLTEDTSTTIDLPSAFSFDLGE